MVITNLHAGKLDWNLSYGRVLGYSNSIQTVGGVYTVTLKSPGKRGLVGGANDG